LNTGDFLISRHGIGTGSRRFAADINKIGAAGLHLDRGGFRRAGIEMPSAVCE
jgi:hypothetical protein